MLKIPFCLMFILFRASVHGGDGKKLSAYTAQRTRALHSLSNVTERAEFGSNIFKSKSGIRTETGGLIDQVIIQATRIIELLTFQ
jgi:hypothetical protein